MSEQQQGATNDPWVPGAGAPGGVAYGGPQPLQPGAGPLGKVRGSWACLGLSIITLGIYPLYWFFQVHQEMKQHTGRGLGGVLALILYLIVGPVMPFITSGEVGNLYASRGRPKPVSGLTGLWYIPGFLILVGPFVWFFKTNGALNDYWRALGAH